MGFSVTNSNDCNDKYIQPSQGKKRAHKKGDYLESPSEQKRDKKTTTVGQERIRQQAEARQARYDNRLERKAKRERPEEVAVKSASGAKVQKGEDEMRIPVEEKPHGNNPFTTIGKDALEKIIGMLSPKDQQSFRQVDKATKKHVEQAVVKDDLALLENFTQFLMHELPEHRAALDIKPEKDGLRHTPLDNPNEALYAARNKVLDVLVLLPKERIEALQNAAQNMRLPPKFEQVFKIALILINEQEDESKINKLIEELSDVYQALSVLDKSTNLDLKINFAKVLSIQTIKKIINIGIDRPGVDLIEHIFQSLPDDVPAKQQAPLLCNLMRASMQLVLGNIDKVLTFLDAACDGYVRVSPMFYTSTDYIDLIRFIVKETSHLDAEANNYMDLIRFIVKETSHLDAEANNKIFAHLLQKAQGLPSRVDRAWATSTCLTGKALVHLKRGEQEGFVKYFVEAIVATPQGKTKRELIEHIVKLVVHESSSLQEDGRSIVPVLRQVGTRDAQLIVLNLLKEYLTVSTHLSFEMLIDTYMTLIANTDDLKTKKNLIETFVDIFEPTRWAGGGTLAMYLKQKPDSDVKFALLAAGFKKGSLGDAGYLFFQSEAERQAKSITNTALRQWITRIIGE